MTSSKPRNKLSNETGQIFAPKLNGNYFPASRSETTYEFWNRLDRPFGHMVRNALQTWLDRYDDEKKRKKVLVTMRNSINRVFASCLLELYLHQIFKNLGYDIEIEKHKVGSSCPDFYLSKGIISFLWRHFVQQLIVKLIKL